ncbi:MAG: DUF1533 domain-containing protein [Oscillospiraceae bacterium]|nr:DUF1533 domain-containing protein [Oscillospiraceae bacterium]
MMNKVKSRRFIALLVGMSIIVGLFAFQLMASADTSYSVDLNGMADDYALNVSDGDILEEHDTVSLGDTALNPASYDIDAGSLMIPAATLQELGVGTHVLLITSSTDKDADTIQTTINITDSSDEGGDETTAPIVPAVTVEPGDEIVLDLSDLLDEFADWFAAIDGISIDGVPVDSSNFVVGTDGKITLTLDEELAEGSYAVKITADGYDDVTFTLTVEEEDTTEPGDGDKAAPILYSDFDEDDNYYVQFDPDETDWLDGIKIYVNDEDVTDLVEIDPEVGVITFPNSLFDSDEANIFDILITSEGYEDFEDQVYTYIVEYDFSNAGYLVNIEEIKNYLHALYVTEDDIRAYVEDGYPIKFKIELIQLDSSGNEKLFTDALAGETYDGLDFFTLKITKTANNETEEITGLLEQPLFIEFALPEDLQGSDFKVLMIIDGEAQIVDAIVSEDGTTLSFTLISLDEFAIATTLSDDGGKKDDNKKDGNKKDDKKTGGVKTADETPEFLIFAILGAGAIAGVVVINRKRKVAVK